MMRRPAAAAAAAPSGRRPGFPTRTLQPVLFLPARRKPAVGCPVHNRGALMSFGSIEPGDVLMNPLNLKGTADEDPPGPQHQMKTNTSS